MPRKYTRKTNRGQTPIDVLKKATGAFCQSAKLRLSAREFNVSKTTLKRFVDQMSIDEDTAKKSGYKYNQCCSCPNLPHSSSQITPCME